MTNHLAPLEEPFSRSVADILAKYPRIDGYLLTLFRTFANSPRFATRCVPNLLDRDSPLPLRIREITILRVTANSRCEYEWGVHVAVFAGAAGFTTEQVADTIAVEPDPALWAPGELNLIRVIDAFCASGCPEPALKEVFQHTWTVEQQLEIMALCGTYQTISFVANLADLPSEDFAATFPQADE